MQAMTITLYPTLDAINNPLVLSESLKKIKDMVVDNIMPILEDIAIQVLEMAKDNASQGYYGLPFPDQKTTVWDPRADLTLELYDLRNRSRFGKQYSESGMDTGYHRLIDSLTKFGEKNIFEREDKSIVIGTSFKYAKLLEEGGMVESSHVGFHMNGEPKRWLLEVLALEFGGLPPKTDPNYKEILRKAEDKAEELWNRLRHPRYVPPRPFLRPALWFLRDKGQHITIAIKTLETEMKIDLELSKMKIEKE